MILQRYDTPAIDLVLIQALDETAPPPAIPFRFAAPGARVRLTVKFYVRAIKDATTTTALAVPFDWTASNTWAWSLWLAKTVIGDSGQRLPVANLFGSRSGPVQLSSFPDTPSVNGISIDVDNVGGDGIDGEMTLSKPGSGFFTTGVRASIRGRYNAIAPLCDEEWAYLRGKFGGYPDGPGKPVII